MELVNAWRSGGCGGGCSGCRQLLTILWMMNKLYPKLMPEATLKEEIRKFYTTFFLYDMSDAQISEIINRK